MPPPEYLAVISTLTIHPSLTTRASTQDKSIQSNTALRLLWTISKTAGPVNARLNEAFRFRRYEDRLSLRNGNVEENDDGDWRNKLTITYADKDSLYNLADDFWAVVGWALNCSCLPGSYDTRWSHWLLWLEYMLETLETDWTLREEEGTCDQSLLWQYIKSADGGNAKGRRVLRAIFADGSATALREFRAIFPKELKERKQERKELKNPEVRVDIDEDIYGDWMQESDSSSTTDEGTAAAQQLEPISTRPSKRLRTRSPSTRRRMTPRATKSLHTDHEDSEESTTENNSTDHGLGPPESMRIRLRLLQLLSHVSAHHEFTSSTSEVNWPDPHELFTLFVEFVRPLPLPTFQQFALPTNSRSSSVGRGLTAETRMALCEFLLQRVVDSEHTSRTSTFAPMTVERLVQNYLPYASGKNTVEFQAKVSVLLESVLRQLARDNNIAADQREDVLGVLEEGIAVRAAKARDVRAGGRYKRAATSGQEELAARVLEDSGVRMKFVLERLVR